MINKIFIFFTILLVSCSSPSANFSSPMLRPEVLNGTPAYNNQFPSAVALMLQAGQTPLCTGTLIKADLILTASHCLANWGHPITIAYNTVDPTKLPAEQLLPTKAKLPHPCYLLNNGYDDDIGLVLLSSPIPNAITSEILPPDQFSNLTIGKDLTILGYGQHVKDQPGDALYFATAPIVEKKNDYEMTVGLGSLGAANYCYGDSGSGTLIDVDGKKYITGITSRAPGIPECGYGAVVTIPGSYLDWIESSYIKLVNSSNTDTGCPNYDTSSSSIVSSSVSTSSDVSSSSSSSSGVGGNDGIIQPEDNGHKGCNISNSSNTGNFELIMMILVMLGLSLRYRFLEFFKSSKTCR